MIRETLGREFLTVTPGIRLKDDAVGDQKRVATPDFARKAGCLIYCGWTFNYKISKSS